MEYFYGDMGEVEKEIRTIRISPSEVQTYITEYEYDSWNRIQKMVYPDGERLDFGYNIAGNLTILTGYKPLGKSQFANRQPPSASSGQPTAYSYIKQQGYDEFEQKVYRRLGNDTETTYTYDPVMRRLSSLVAHRDTPVAPSVFQNNRYSYDLVGNILSVENAISQQPSAISSLGGSSKYTYEYDELNRLIKAKGNFEGTSNKADYELNMQYNRLNGIVQKVLQYTLNGQDKGYTLNYEYNDKKHPHAPSSIAELGKPKARNYTYDGNGNPTYYDEFKGFRSMVWDEENRLRGINDNGRLHLYTYDHTGERALKSSAESSMAVINGLASAVITHTEDYTAYVSPYFVVQKGKFTKHYFEGSSRIVSKLGEGTFSHKNTGIMADGLDYLTRSKKEEEVRQKYIKGLQVPPGPPTQHGIYASPEWTGQPYPSIDWEAISQNQEPPAGWPRYPRFNEPGDVPGPPVQFGEAITNANAKAGHGFIPNGVEEKNLYYYHPDHLGSSSYITDRNGEVIQHTEYMAFGEVLVDEHSTSNKQPYLFNGKELDYETGLYYYGARYYDAKTSIFLNVDPLVEKTGTPYAYVNNNPINLIDPTGMIWEKPKQAENLNKQINKRIDRIEKNIIKTQNKINTGKLSESKRIKFENRLIENNRKKELLQKSLQDIENIKNASEIYRLTGPSQDNGKHGIIKNEDGSINIEGSNNGLYIHEIRHIGQYMDKNKELRFNDRGQLVTPAETYSEARNLEVEAYQVQYSFDGSYPAGASSLNDINENTIMNIKTDDGVKVYEHINK